MVTFLIVFCALTALTIYAIKTTRQIDRIEEAEWEFVDDRIKMEMCLETVENNGCGFRCSDCPWYVKGGTE